MSNDEQPVLWSVLLFGMGLALGGLGLFFILMPEPAAQVFGIPAEGKHALSYVRALGIRDVALCLYILVLGRLWVSAVRMLVGISALIPAGDLALVLLESGLSVPLQLALHAVSGIALLALAAWPPRRK